jgi:hypothetical protein
MEQDCKFQTNVEQILSNRGFTFIYTPLGT